MSTKAKKKPEAKSETKSASKPAAKTNKKSEIIEVTTLEVSSVEVEVVDEDEVEEAAARTRSTDSNAAALAAATAGGTSEMSASFKNFRHHPDMENFYRFIFENDLRFEALAIMDEMLAQKAMRSVVKTAKKVAH